MGFYEDELQPMLRKTADVIEKCPHMQDFVNGTLSKEKFAFYMYQDYQYLLDYIKVWATALGKSEDYEQIRDIMEILDANLVGIDYIRNTWTKDIGITVDELDATIQSEGKRDYTSFQLMVANTCDICGLFCSVFPCGIMYTYFGEDLLPKCKLPKDDPCYKWIEYYTTPEYKKEAANKIAILNKYCTNKTPREKAKLLEIVAISCNYEIIQWTRTYPNMETWPLEEIFPKKFTTIKE